MKSFSKDNIDYWRNEFTSRNYTKCDGCLDGRVVEYFVMPSNLFNGIPNGLFRMTGEPKDGYLVGVSDETPGIVRPHFAMSEHDEFIVYGLGDENRTLNSESNMIRIIGEGEIVKDYYIKNKLALYYYILNNSKDCLEEWGFSRKDYEGFQRAVEFLEKSK